MCSVASVFFHSANFKMGQLFINTLSTVTQTVSLRRAAYSSQQCEVPPPSALTVCVTLHREAAVDLNHLTGDVTRVVGKQKAGDACYFIRLRKAAKRNLLGKPGAICLIQ